MASPMLTGIPRTTPEVARIFALLPGSGRQAGGADDCRYPWRPERRRRALGGHRLAHRNLQDEVDPQSDLRDVLARIVASHPMGWIDELLPFAYVSAADKAAA